MTTNEHAERLDFLALKHESEIGGWAADRINSVTALRAGAAALRKPPGAGKLSNYAFRKYGNDALLYNGVKEIEEELASALRAVEGAKAALNRFQNKLRYTGNDAAEINRLFDEAAAALKRLEEL